MFMHKGTDEENNREKQKSSWGSQRVETVNLGSQGVMRSCGFELMSRREEEWPKDKGGGVREVGEWELKLR
jgi:hypothetical protein